jgi:2-amino-4-hydroxy-6-hydroxymethyldihydropteridine diphosphokinase
MSNIAYLSLGSNIEPEDNLKSAVRMLATLTYLMAVSSVWETRPLGMANQPNFLNAAAIVKTDLEAKRLKWQVIDRIEQCLGRVRQINKNVPRPIDIDIMLFNHQIIELGDRHIPDPELLERPFVAIPLAEIAPDYRHPETGQTLRAIARSFAVKNGDMRLCQDASQALSRLKLQHNKTQQYGENQWIKQA